MPEVLAGFLLLALLWGLVRQSALADWLSHFFLRLALRRLPKDQRPVFELWWSSELYYQTRPERLSSAYGHWRRGSKVEAARLNPTKAASDRRVKQFFGAFAVVGLLTRGLGDLGLYPDQLFLVSKVVLEGAFMALFAAMMTLAVLSWTSVRGVWWRAAAMVAFFLAGGGLLAADLLYMTSRYPETVLLQVLTALLGVVFARYDYRLSSPGADRLSSTGTPR